jgi:hypothetical protein
MTQTKSGGVITRQYEYNAKGEQVHAYLWSNGVTVPGSLPAASTTDALGRQAASAYDPLKAGGHPAEKRGQVH